MNSEPNGGLGLGSDPLLSGVCLALIAFNSLAFVIDGVKRSKRVGTTTSTWTSSSAATAGSMQNIAPTGGINSFGNDTTRPTSASPPTPNTGSNGNKETSKSGFAAGASAGAGVGAALGVLGNAIVLWFFLRKHKSKHTSGAKRVELPESKGPTSRTLLNSNQIHATMSGLPPQFAGNALNEGDNSEVYEMGLGQKTRFS